MRVLFYDCDLRLINLRILLDLIFISYRTAEYIIYILPSLKILKDIYLEIIFITIS